MLRADLIDELTKWLTPVLTPTLLREIIGNLSKEHTPRKGKMPPQDVLRALARKLKSSGAAIPVSFTKLALNDILGDTIEMNGFSVPVDSTAGNVHAKGGMLMVDGTLQQQMFARWEAGDFSDGDRVMAHAWRSGVAQVDYAQISKHAKTFVAKYADGAKAIENVIAAVDVALCDPDMDTQLYLMALLLALLKGRPTDAGVFGQTFLTSPGTTLRTFAPYASGVLRVYLVFAACVRLGIVKRDANSVADLQYLFYTPFATGFVSNDALHQRLFPAAAGKAAFIKGDALKADLQQRKAWRDSLSFDEWSAHRAQYGIYPKEFPNSPINDIWARTLAPGFEAPRPIERTEPERLNSINNDPQFRHMVEAMRQLQEESRARKRPETTAWPFGAVPEDPTPM